EASKGTPGRKIRAEPARRRHRVPLQRLSRCCQRFVADGFLGTEAPSLRHSEPGRPALRIPRKFCHPLTVELTFQKFVRWVHRLLRSRSDSHATFEPGSTT